MCKSHVEEDRKNNDCICQWRLGSVEKMEKNWGLNYHEDNKYLVVYGMVYKLADSLSDDNEWIRKIHEHPVFSFIIYDHLFLFFYFQNILNK